MFHVGETRVRECIILKEYISRRRDTILQNAFAIVAPAIPILDGVIRSPKLVFGVDETRKK